MVPACINRIDAPHELSGVAAVHKHADGTYFFLTSDGYWTYTSDKESGEEELLGSTDYKDIADLPLNPQRYMGFQPSLHDDVFLLILGNMVVPVTFNDKQIQISAKRADQLIR